MAEVQLEAKVIRNHVRQTDCGRGVWCNQFCDRFLPHHDTEPPLAIRHYLILSLVGSTGEIREIDDNRLTAFGLAGQPIDSARPLLDRARVPGQIVMYHVAAESLEVDPFAHDLTTDQDVRVERCVERLHETPTTFACRLTGRNLHVRQRESGIFISFTPHALRHTFGTRWLQAGGDIYKLSKILGHSSVAVTEAHYAHLLKEDLVAASQQVKIPIAPRTGGRVVSMNRQTRNG